MSLKITEQRPYISIKMISDNKISKKTIWKGLNSFGLLVIRGKTSVLCLVEIVATEKIIKEKEQVKQVKMIFFRICEVSWHYGTFDYLGAVSLSLAVSILCRTIFIIKSRW